MKKELFCDGGLVGSNPSLIAGTWAWRRVESGIVVAEGSGVVWPEEIGRGAISNNNTEVIAILRGVLALPVGWRGTVCSDSLLALGWIFKRFDPRTLPEELKATLKAIRFAGCFDGLTICPLGGHPTRADLARGVRARRPQLRVSEHNVHCDAECRRLAQEIKAGRYCYSQSRETDEGKEEIKR